MLSYGLRGAVRMAVLCFDIDRLGFPIMSRRIGVVRTQSAVHPSRQAAYSTLVACHHSLPVAATVSRSVHVHPLIHNAADAKTTSQ